MVKCKKGRISMAIIKSSKLYFREGESDKVYHAFIESAPGGFVVNFEFGRTGTKLQTGTKTTKGYKPE